MIRFILKMLWSQRKKYYSIFTEQVLITIALMICMVSFSIAFEKYRRPGLLDVSNQIYFSIHCSKMSNETFQKSYNSEKIIVQKMKEKPYIINVTREIDLAPYLRSDNFYMGDSVQIKEQKRWVKIKYADEKAIDVFKIHLDEGSWFEGETLPDGSCPTILTRQLVNSIVGENKESLIGYRFTYRNRECTVIGIAAGLKQRAFDSSAEAVIFHSKYYYGMGTPSYIFKIKEGYVQDFYKDCLKEFQKLALEESYITNISEMEISESKDRFEEILKITSQATPTLFLIIFAFIGTFGLFWMQSKKKAKEYALQIAIGLAPHKLISNIVSESIIITLLAAVPSLIIAAFIYDFTVVHVIAIIATILIMLLFAVFSAWYPAYKVSRIHPAEVLHYE